VRQLQPGVNLGRTRATSQAGVSFATYCSRVELGDPAVAPQILVDQWTGLATNLSSAPRRRLNEPLRATEGPRDSGGVRDG